MIITVARKPILGTVVQNCLDHQVGCLNILKTRIPLTAECSAEHVQRQQSAEGSVKGAFGAQALIGTEILTYKPEGRWPANVVLTNDTPRKEFPTVKSPQTYTRQTDSGSQSCCSNSVPIGESAGTVSVNYGDNGSAARFFKQISSDSEMS